MGGGVDEVEDEELFSLQLDVSVQPGVLEENNSCVYERRLSLTPPSEEPERRRCNNCSSDSL